MALTPRVTISRQAASRIYAIRAPYICTRSIKEMPGARWAPGIRIWTVPPDLALHVERRLAAGGARVIPPSTDWPPVPDGQGGAEAPPCPLPFRPYQIEAVHWLTGACAGQGLLALPMGAGKSAVAIAAATGPVLVVVPAIVRSVWAGSADRPGEIAKWAPDADVRVIRGRTFDEKALAGLAANAFVVVSYESLDFHRDKTDLDEEGRARMRPSPWLDPLCVVRWGTIICDEAHYIKNRKGARYAALHRIAGAAGPGVRRIPLTGTPIWNRPSDLWAILDWLHPGRWGSFWVFAKRYADAAPGEYGWSTSGVSNAEELSDRLRWVCFRRTKAEILDWLPPKIRQVVAIESEAAVRRINKATSRLLALTGRRPSRAEILGLLHAEGGVKGKEVRGILQGAWGRSVVFAYRRSTVDSIAEAVRKDGKESWAIHGDIPADVRETRIREWAASWGGVICATIGVAGIGIDLSAGSNVIFVDLDYVPAAMAQAEDRVHRPGQAGSVTVYYLAIRGTVDEDVALMVADKLGQQIAILGPDADSAGILGVAQDLSGAGDDQAVINAMLVRLGERDG